MKWTKTKPTSPGLYAFKPRYRRAKMVRVANDGVELYAAISLAQSVYLRNVESDTQWYGPIEEPSDKDPLENLQYAHVGLREDCPYD